MLRCWSQKNVIICSSLLVVIFLHILFLSFLFKISLLPPTGIDDSNITFTYAKNLANGHGFVYTPGYEKVEGATSLLWTFLCSLGFLVTPHPEFLILLTCIAMTFVACLGTVQIVQIVTNKYSNTQRHFSLFLIILWLAMIPGYYAWNLITLMDLTLWSLFVVITTLVLCNEIISQGQKSSSIWLLSIIGALITIVRPESMAFFPIVIMTAMFCRWYQTHQVKSILRYTPPVLSFLFSEAILITIRFLYFGFPLPNTYYAKVSNDTWYNILQGAKYIVRFYLTSGIQYVLLTIACAFVVTFFLADFVKCIAKKKKSIHSDSDLCLFAISTITLSGFMFPLVGGGDHFGSFRFMQPFIPLLAIPSIAIIVRKIKIIYPKWSHLNGSLVALSAVSVTVVLMGVQLGIYRYQHRLSHEFSIASRGRREAIIWNQVSNLYGDMRIGVITTGGFGYLHKGRTVDLLGLNWVAMGHSEGSRFGDKNHASFSIKTFWEDPPDVVFDNNCEVSMIRETPFLIMQGIVTRPYFNLLLKGLPSTPRFIKYYLPVEIFVNKNSVKGYVSREWVSKHNDSNIRIIGWRQNETNEQNKLTAEQTREVR